MTKAADILYLGLVAIFIASGLSLATLGRPAIEIVSPDFSRIPSLDAFGIGGTVHLATLPQLYVQPQNVLMWMLLLALWVLLILDAVGQYLDPSDREPYPAWHPLSLALVSGAIWPWLVGLHKPLATLGAMLMMTAALSAAIRGRQQRRPALAFFAGWGVALGTATVATLIGAPLAMTTPQAAILAFLPGAVIGMIAQERLERSLAFSVAIIWAFCAVAVTTMGSNPGVALAAIIGISGMGVVLVRAAT